MAIAKAIIQFMILRALEKAAGLPPGTLTGGGGKTGLFGLFHSGGVVGSGSGSVRRDNPAAWNGAPKFHGGGMAGIRNDEYRTILKRGEEVLTEENPRHINNAGQNGGGTETAGVNGFKQVLAFGDDEIAGAMSGPAGDKVQITFIRRHATMIKQIINS
jgi:hypothetical protein